MGSGRGFVGNAGAEGHVDAAGCATADADGARAIGSTADHIWRALGDTSEDYNWYTKRATLSGVYSSTVLFWLGDDSLDHHATWEFLDRRIDDIMQIEKIKAQVRKSPILSKLMSGPNWLASQIKARMKTQPTAAGANAGKGGVSLRSQAVKQNQGCC